jgi:hypothetical protein
MSVEDMVSQVLPPLGAVIGTGKPLNCLVTNKWRNLAEIERITQLPLLLLASVQVSGGCLLGLKIPQDDLCVAIPGFLTVRLWITISSCHQPA